MSAHDALEHLLLDFRRNARLVAVREQRAHLHAGGAAIERLGERLGPAEPARKPEREFELGELVEVDLVAFAVDRLTLVIQLKRAARRRVMAARRRPLDDEPVHLAVRLAGEGGGERVRGNDGQELGPLEGRAVGDVPGRIELEQVLLTSDRPVDLQLERGLPPLGERVECARDLARDACSHQHVVHAGQHRAVQRGERRHLNLGEQVDAYDAIVTFLGQVHFHEVRGDRDPLADGSHRLPEHRQRLVRLVGRLAARPEILFDDLVCDAGDREAAQRPAHRTAGIAVLQAAHENGVDSGARNDAELAGHRNGTGECPIRHPNAHPSLDHHWQCGGGHQSSLSEIDAADRTPLMREHP